MVACNSLAFTTGYTPEQDNAIADALSCFNFQCFHLLAPHAAHIRKCAIKCSPSFPLNSSPARLSEAFPSCSSTCTSHHFTNITIAVGPASCDLTGKCQFHLTNGLAHSSRQVYGSAQHQFLEFCSQDFLSGLGHSLLPASEQTLMRFCAHLTDCLHHSSIKVYLLAVHSLHIDYGYPDPLSNCLQLKPF